VQLALRAADLAREKGCTLAQLALAWLLAKGPEIVPIPGTKSRTRLEENAGAVAVTLSTAEVTRLEAALPPGVAEGARYPERLAPVWE
jgi:aryl-alcohol dehydrogenase-like predicted oxidoreductase